jgi:hypothetical protein
MTDQRLRDLEREAARGDLQAQARLLLERVRVGDLTEEKLRLAAYLGDEAAKLAVAGGGPEAEHEDLATWLTSIETRGFRRPALEAIATAAGLALSPNVDSMNDHAVGTQLIRELTGAPVRRAAEAHRLAGAGALLSIFRLIGERYSRLAADREDLAGRVSALREEVTRGLTHWALASRGSST